MLRRFSIDFAIFSYFLDFALIALALRLASIFRPAMNELAFARYIPGPILLPAYLYLLFPLLWTLTLYAFSVYDGQRNLRFWKEITNLSIGSLLAMIALAGILYLSFRETSRLLYLSFVATAFFFILTWRVLYRMFFNSGVIKGVKARRILIIGDGLTGIEVQKQIESYRNLGLTVVGTIANSLNSSQPVVELLSEAQHIIQQEQVDDVVITLSEIDHVRLYQVLTQLSVLPVRLWIVPEYMEFTIFKARIDEFAGIPMVDLRASGLTDTQRIIKRSFDLVLVILLSPFYLPVMGVIGLLIRRESPGPLLFCQARAGENGRIFTLYKFRSMVVNAEELRHLVEVKDSQGHVFYKTQDDPRITRIGRFLRRTSLDELPQIFNVLRGEMSLVGPRPELPYLVERYEPWQHQRFSVPPGMTGWWQIHGRGDRPMHLNTKDDLYYIENYSIFLDIFILVKTFGVVWRRQGAY